MDERNCCKWTSSRDASCPKWSSSTAVVRYKDKMLAQQDIYAERPPFGVKNLKTGRITTPLIENEIRFYTVNSTRLPKDHISVFLAPNHRERIAIVSSSPTAAY
ncbi:nuclear pore membrane glycoprotein 210-like [Drosophila guanche]|uniref:Uncharacterized protein n=1 Tax=Drosophila guanche TaxID=7266 RepID=A0A3B0J7D6_DROGU|nr:nuclear pore membrane glycoprotein 210-like [Drosophila guanche]SPP75812.1 Hypothetical predicted protein [Drosophila guanche]